MNYRKSLITGIFLSLGASVACAEFEVAGSGFDGGSGYLVVFSNDHKQPSKIPTAKGSSNNERLAASLKRLAPNGWKARIEHNGEVNSSCRISWTGGSEWTDVLDEALQGTGLFATVDWAKKTMTLQRANNGFCVDSAKDVASSSSYNGFKGSGDWNIRAGSRLSEGLRAAAKRNGWNLQWSLPYDFPVEQDIPLSGDVTGMMRTLVRAYQRMGEMQGVTPIINDTNKVIEMGTPPMAVQAGSAATSLNAENVRGLVNASSLEKPEGTAVGAKEQQTKQVNDTQGKEKPSNYAQDYTYTP